MNSTWTFGDFLRKLYQVFTPPPASTTSSSSLSQIPGTGTSTGESSGSGSRLNTARNISLSTNIAKGNLDLYQISSRVNRSFFTSPWDGPPPFTTLYIIPLILALGLVVALIWLWCSCSYHTMKKLKSWCPSLKSKKDKRGNDEEDPTNLRHTKEMPTPEILEQRRQERLSILQQECENLEQQLTGLLEAEERNTTLTSRASDSDLEYLGVEDSPPLKRNSISLQDIPQSVIRIRREKQLRQLKEEIERLQAISQQELSAPLRSPLLTDIKFEFNGSKYSKSSSPSPVDVSVVEPLSQHISHLKAQRKLQEIRAELEDLAIHLVHADELKAKTSSYQDLPRTALIAKRQANLLNISKEIENIKNYKLQERDILSTVLQPPAKSHVAEKNEILAKLNKDTGKSFIKQGNPSPSKSPLLKRQESEMSDASTTKTVDTALGHSSSLKRTREHELNRVRVELKELSYKLNLNYSFDNDRERERILPRDWPKQCSFSRENSLSK